MPLGATNPQQFLLDIAESMNNVNYQNPQFVDFVRFLLRGRPIRASYLSGQTPPGAITVALDVAVICAGGPGFGPSLVSVTARRTGAVEWGLIDLRALSAVTTTVVGNLAITKLTFGSVGTIQIAALANEEGDMNAFTLEAAAAAGF